MYNNYLTLLNNEARNALTNIRTYRAAGDIEAVRVWADYYFKVNQERQHVRAMSLADFVDYFFTVLLVKGA